MPTHAIEILSEEKFVRQKINRRLRGKNKMILLVID